MADECRAAVVKALHFVVPANLDDPTVPTGGNVYDHRIHRELAGRGWHVVRHRAPGAWPTPDAAAEQELARTIGQLPDGAVVLVDDIIASTVAHLMVPMARRLKLVVLVHTSLGEAPPGHQVSDAQASERAVLLAAHQVVTTSGWTRDRLLWRYPLPPDRVHVAEPGVDRASLALGTELGGQLLCVAAVSAHKGHDVLLAALTDLAELPWRCVCVGTLGREPAFVDELRRRAAAAGLDDRFTLAGVRTGGDLDRAYAAADILVFASRAETYGMVVTEALARGLPVIASEVGGIPGALGLTRAGRRPGLLVPAGDPDVLATALRRWLTDEDLRRRLRADAQERRSTLSGWPETARRIDHALQLTGS